MFYYDGPDNSRLLVYTFLTSVVRERGGLRESQLDVGLERSVAAVVVLAVWITALKPL